ncbi:uncharacterized protein LOC132937046 [Metopolophium dirhodum]|uniref:uncharacterized protein LOC132937046 n=1 Tax=Metopolophium dirhodum TaxID=44670 RepID=UPI00298FD0E9|nr:uncharacterized protein LOC132937046 [Metopolophium dirhodum]
MINVSKKKLYVNIDKFKVLEACTEMVTVNGRPLTIFHDSGFKKILDPLTAAIGEGFTINSHNIKKNIFLASNTIIKEITNDVNNKLISLKIDCVKRHNRSIMGVNIQYVKNGRVCLATLAMKEVHEQHTADNFKKMLLEVLQKYDMVKQQIYSITCDNASNMVKLARIMNDECEEINVIVPNLNENDSDSDIDLEYENGEGTSLSIDDIEGELFNDDFENDDNTNKEVEDFQRFVMNAIEPKSITSCIRCSVHSLQLCVLHGLKNAHITSCITEARKVVKKLRTPKYASWLKRKHLKYAVIDIETRWNSLYNMLYRLLELKEFCKLHDGTNPDVRLRDCEWESIQSVVNALNPAKTATLALQKQDLNLGNFYGIWLKAIHGLTADGSILAKTIKIAMEKELKEKYLENSTFLAAIYVDPRYQCLLTHDQQDLAINRLVETWETLQLLKDKNPELNRSNSSLDAAGQRGKKFFGTEIYSFRFACIFR